jgi:hypothetical protein
VVIAKVQSGGHGPGAWWMDCGESIVDFYFEFLPAKIEESISILNIFPPKSRSRFLIKTKKYPQSNPFNQINTNISSPQSP